MEWTTLLWNTTAIEFYESLNATPNDLGPAIRLIGESLDDWRTAAAPPKPLLVQPAQLLRHSLLLTTNLLCHLRKTDPWVASQESGGNVPPSPQGSEL